MSASQLGDHRPRPHPRQRLDQLAVVGVAAVDHADALRRGDRRDLPVLSSTVRVKCTTRCRCANSSRDSCPSVVSNGSHGSIVRSISVSCRARDFTPRWCTARKAPSRSGSPAASPVSQDRILVPSASRTAARVSSSYSDSREAVGRRLSVSRTQRTKNAQSGSSCSARSVSSMPSRCTRWVARWAGLTADGGTYATPRTPATGTSRSIESSGVKPNSSWQCRASAARRPAGPGWARSQGAGSSVTGSPPTRTSYGSSEPKSRARARTRSGASHSAAPARAVRYTVVPGSGRSAAGSVRTVYEPSSRAVHSTGGASGVRALRLTTRIRSATRKQASSPMPNWPRKSAGPRAGPRPVWSCGRWSPAGCARPAR